MSWDKALQQKAHQQLSPEIIDFIEAGADDESTTEQNQKMFSSIKLIPRHLRNVSKINTELTLCNTRLKSPILIAPTAPQRLVHDEGELAVARGANLAGNLMVVSCMSSFSLEKIADELKSPFWFQLHIFKNKDVTASLVKRAVKAGCQALVVTVDMPVVGHRKKDITNHFKIPKHCLAANLIIEGLLKDEENTSVFNKHTNALFDPMCTWEDIHWLKTLSPLPIFLKGILHPQDAQIAIDHGIDGLILSNHGGRQLGQVVSPLQVLPHIAEKVEGKIPLLMDGGIRSGVDIVKALALGAKAVLIGRPILWGLTVGSSSGVSGVLHQLQRELAHTMKLCGCANLADFNQDLCLIQKMESLYA